MASNIVRVRVKICGVRSVDDALAAADAGADAVGLNFHPPSPRYVDPWRARQIVEALPPFVTSVGLFVDLPADEVRRLVVQTRVDMLQFHGAEDGDYCPRFDRPYLKAVRLAPGQRFDAEAFERAHPHARAVLLDAWHETVAGGSGCSFDWHAVDAGPPVVLAGGLSADNVERAIDVVGPFAVDVSSGVERAPGVKDPALMRAFVRAAVG